MLHVYVLLCLSWLNKWDFPLLKKNVNRREHTFQYSKILPCCRCSNASLGKEAHPVISQLLQIHYDLRQSLLRYFCSTWISAKYNPKQNLCHTRLIWFLECDISFDIKKSVVNEIVKGALRDFRDICSQVSIVRAFVLTINESK